jgi:FkbM family methyltransferase
MITAAAMNLSERILRRRNTFRYFARKGLARLPFLPVPIRIKLADGTELNIWWSYMPGSNIAGLPLTGYWSSDRSDLQFVWNFLQPGMTFFDLGAYHGIYSIVAAKRLGSQGHVTAFEPSERERRRLGLHLQMNGCHVSVEPYAVTSEAGSFRFFAVASGFTSMNSLVYPPTDNPVSETNVDGICLDQYLATKGSVKVDLMKFDIEGAELDAFRGARHMLEVVRPLIICEVLDWVTRPWGYPARAIVESLNRLDYQWFDFCEDGALAVHAERDEYSDVRNYLAVPREKIPQIESWRHP